jgi:hypothetical protein
MLHFAGFYSELSDLALSLLFQDVNPVYSRLDLNAYGLAKREALYSLTQSKQGQEWLLHNPWGVDRLPELAKD